jgi:cytochrome oxidase Cu insertion factor (SCO1/SenC/PrrC family)
MTLVVVEAVRDTCRFRVGAFGLICHTSKILSRCCRVAYRRDAPDASGDYAVYHSSAVFVFDQNGSARLLATPAETSDELAEDLKAVIR